MTEIEAIKELNTYVSDEHKLTLSRECIDLARNALEKQISLERILERLEEFAIYYEKSVEELIKKPLTEHNLLEREKCLDRMETFRDAIEIIKEEVG